MDFLRNVLHMDVRIKEEPVEWLLPNYLAARYTVKAALFNGQEVLLVYPKTEPEQIAVIRKHFAKLWSYKAIPAVLVLQQITARQRQACIDAGISFAVENKQCYLPFMGTVLTEKCNAQEVTEEKLSPSAQLLLLYFLHTRQKELYTNTAVDALGISAMSVTRAVRQLEQLGLIKTHKNGVLKVMSSPFSRRELFEKAREHMISPIKRNVYIPKAQVTEAMLIAGDQALAQYSMLNPPRLACYATEKWELPTNQTMVNEDSQAILQIWKYNPMALCDGSCVDVLSLALCYQNDSDERVEEAIEEMLNDYWGDTNG